MTFPILCDLIEPEVIVVSDEDMIRGMKLAAERMKIVVEASAGASIAAATSKHLGEKFPGLKKVGVIVCGGNVDIDKLPWTEKS